MKIASHVITSLTFKDVRRATCIADPTQTAIRVSAGEHEVYLLEEYYVFYKEGKYKGYGIPSSVVESCRILPLEHPDHIAVKFAGDVTV